MKNENKLYFEIRNKENVEGWDSCEDTTKNREWLKNKKDHHIITLEEAKENDNFNEAMGIEEEEDTEIKEWKKENPDWSKKIKEGIERRTK